jgi:CDK inhibitor PHO81
VLRDLADRATTARLELEAWAEGENIQYDTSRPTDRIIGQRIGTDESDVDLQILQAAVSGNTSSLREWISKLSNSPDARDTFTRVFLASISDSPDESLGLFLESGLVDIHAEDDVNERNCLHEAAIYGKEYVLDYALQNNVDVSRVDVYGRIPLHYACLRGRVSMSQKLIEAGPTTVDLKDHDNFTPLIHSIVRNRIECVQQLLAHNAQIDPTSDADHIPLNLACQHGSTEVATLLLERNARLLPDAEGLYPQHLVARSSQTPHLLLLLKEHGADLNQKDKLYQWTPLFHAASEGRVECLRTLLLNGAQPDALDEKGLTAMYYATWEGNLECMNLLWKRSGHRIDAAGPTTRSVGTLAPSQIQTPNAVGFASPHVTEIDGIPDLSLPPPIIPLRRYGHNFLDTKTYISIHFHRGAESIKFFNEGRYPAARITISSKTSDLIARNIILPIQDDSKAVSFQVDNLDTFAIDLEIFPTFGSKVIAKSVALPEVFRAIHSSSGSCCLPLFDPRLRAVGQIQFNFQVIKPYSGYPLEITQFATYWKSTSALDDHSGLVTGSSLSGDYLQLAVQLTRDGVPILYPSTHILHAGVEIPAGHLKYSTLTQLNLQSVPPQSQLATWSSPSQQIVEWHTRMFRSMTALRDVLAALPIGINLNLQILYPSVLEEETLGLSPTIDINTFADAILTDVFNHARALREQTPDLARSIVFSSCNPHICAALNWKQPNFPVLLCNNLGRANGFDSSHSTFDISAAPSIKESARLAQSNNLMGLICHVRILEMVPALVETIQEAGLILVSDTSDLAERQAGNDYRSILPNRANGVMMADGVLRFNETIEM